MAEPSNIFDFVDNELARRAPEPVIAMASACAERFGEAAEGVLFYGSCLRTGLVEGQVLDFYIIVKSYRAAYGSLLAATANRVLPPNVYYKEIDHDGIKLRAKYAVLSRDDFIRRASGATLNLSIWARFSQPALLCLCDDEDVRVQLGAAIARAACVMIGAARRHVTGSETPAKLWTTAFDLTYGAELRSEKAGKGAELYGLDQDRYDAMTPLILDQGELLAQVDGGGWTWFLRRANGKFVSFARLVKGAFTFDGGIDYLAWKISRHSGVEITPTPWQRRHPILAGVTMFIQLRRRGAFR